LSGHVVTPVDLKERPMPIRLECHGCGQKLWVEQESAGGKVQCPCCPYVMAVPVRVKGGGPASDTDPRGGPLARPRGLRSHNAQTTDRVFDAMEMPQEPALMRAIDGLLLLHPVILFLLPGLFLPFAIIVLIVSNDREATRHAVLVVFFAFIHLAVTVWILIVYKSVDALY
jgi:hypothetical protein